VSIFQQKFCPECSSTQPLAAARCDCGYLFEVDEIRDDTHAAELNAQQERIYLDYLRARAAQAEETYLVAKRRHDDEPESAMLAADMLLAQQQMHTARAELIAQAGKARHAQERAEAITKVTRELTATRAAKPTVAPAKAATLVAPPAAKVAVVKAPPAAAPVVSDAAKSAPATAVKQPPRAVTPVPATAAEPRAQAPVIQPAPSKPVAAAPQPDPRPAAAAPTVATPRPAVTVIQPASPPKPAAATPERSAQPPASAAPVQTAPVPAPRVVESAQPTVAFQQTQAARAERIVSERQPVRVAPPRATNAQPMPKPVARPPADEAKECPNCTASVRLAVMQCRCGFEFSHGAELPAVALTPSERAALLQGLDLSRAPRRA
jgi:hypothetical protein